jgi:hypothetical protein
LTHLLCSGSSFTPVHLVRIFAPIPGAFETPFQSAPLDIFEDIFYSARQELIDQRLAALENGEARDLLEQVLTRERPHRTVCIGVDWDFEPGDLLAITDVCSITTNLLPGVSIDNPFEVSRWACPRNHLSSDMRRLWTMAWWCPGSPSMEHRDSRMSICGSQEPK